MEAQVNEILFHLDGGHRKCAGATPSVRVAGWGFAVGALAAELAAVPGGVLSSVLVSALAGALALGTEFNSGTFFGSDVTIQCRMNAAVMRHEVARVEIRDAHGDVISAADLPEAVEA